MLMKFSTIINRYLERPCLHFISITVLVTAIIILVISCLTPVGRKTVLGTDSGHDYIAFYIVGKILNEYKPDQLYDLQLQYDLYHTLRPYSPAEEILPYPYPPFIALLFSPLARLPFVYSYLAWLFISLSLYMSGLILIFKSVHSIPRSHLLPCFLLALSFEPFIMECWMGGQISSIGFLALALSFYLYQRNRNILSGLALGICLYKPTLLIIILPFLLLTRRYKILLGFTLCGFVLTLISVFAFGWHTCVNWTELTFRFARLTSAEDTIKMFKYIDLIAFLRLLFGEIGQTTRIIFYIIYGIWFAYFISLLRKFRVENRCFHELVIASILTWTAVLNIYFPIYDSIIVITSLLLTIDACYGHFKNTSKTFNLQFKLFLILIYVTPWISQHLARHIGFQPYTIVLIGLGIYQLYMLIQVGRQYLCCKGCFIQVNQTRWGLN